MIDYKNLFSKYGNHTELTDVVTQSGKKAINDYFSK